MQLSYIPGMDDPDNLNPVRTISPSALVANHGIPVPPPSPNRSIMHPPAIPPTNVKEIERDESNIGELLMDLVKNESVDGGSAPTEKEAGTIWPTPTENQAGTYSPTPMMTEASTLEQCPMDLKQKGTQTQLACHSQQQM